jgi:predicted O-methyltransferase YrrM
VTTCVLRKVMASDGVLFAVDPYPVGRLGFSAQRLIARTELAKVPNGSVVWVRCNGAEAAARYAASQRQAVDFVFIDADHSYEGLRADWEGWSGLVAPGGILALHDSRSSSSRRIDEAGSVVFTREVIEPDWRFVTVDVVDTLTVLERRP